MAGYELIMPKLGMYDDDVCLVEWLKSEGSEVHAGEALFTVETDKITSDVEAEAAGWLHQTVEAGAVLPIGTVVGAIAATRDEYEALAAAPSEAIPRNADPAESDVPPREPGPQERAPLPARPASLTISPRARALMEAEGLRLEDVQAIVPTGPDGRLTDRDVLAYLATRSPAEAEPAGSLEPRVERRVPLSGTRAVIARRMLESLRESAQLTSTLEIDVSPLVDWRARLSPRPGFTAIFLALCAGALRAHPLLNARVAGHEIEILADINLGFAVHTESGVVAPVVHQADRLGLGDLDERVRDLSDRARRGALAPHELKGGTFTVSNSGTAPVDTTTAILNPPQVALLWLGEVRERAVVVEGAVAARPTVHACLTYDHRAIDGVPAAEFLGELAARVTAVADTFPADG